MSREQIVRDTAYAIWEAEGKPHGRAAQHWQQAEERVVASVAGKTTPGADPAKSRAAAPKPAARKPAAKKG